MYEKGRCPRLFLLPLLLPLFSPNYPNPLTTKMSIFHGHPIALRPYPCTAPVIPTTTAITYRNENRQYFIGS